MAKPLQTLELIVRAKELPPRSEQRFCDYCGESYIHSMLWPFSNICRECLPEQVWEIATKMHYTFTHIDPTWWDYLPPLEHGHCPLCNHYDSARDPDRWNDD